MKLRTRSMLIAAAVTAVSAYSALGQTIAINAPVEAGNQAFGTGLGIDFTVNSQITITALGIFDDNGDGIAPQPGPPPTDTTLTAVLYSVNRTADTSTELASQEFTTSAPGTLAANSGFRFINLASPITLAPGTYDIAGYGFNNENLEDNSSAAQQLNTGGGVIAFNATYYSFLGIGAAPENYDSDVIKYAAATFEYTGESPYVRTWNGSNSGNWSSGTNWDEGALAANGTDVLAFGTVAGGATQSMTNDLTNLTVNGMTFSTGGYVLGGNALGNTGNIVSSTGNNTINVPLTLTESGTNIEVDAGTLTLAGSVTAPLPGSGLDYVTKTGAGTLVLPGNNDLQSGLIVDGGTVQMTDISDNAGTTSLTVPGQGDNAVAGLLAIYDGTAEVTGTGTQTTARYIYTDQGTNHTLSLDSANLTVVSTGEWRSNGALAAELVKQGAGTLVLSGNDPFFAATTGDRAYNFINVQAGTVVLDRSVGSAVDGVDGIASGALVQIGAGATNDEIFTDLDGAYTPADSAVASSPGLLNITGGTFDLNGQSEIINRLNGTGTVTNSASGSPATLTIGEQNVNAAAGSDNGSFAGAIQDGAGQVAVTMMGSSNTQALSGANTYTGGTNITGGTLIIAATGALPANGAVSITGGELQLATNTGGETLPSLTIGGGGTLDIGNNHVIVSDPNGTIDSAIAGYLAAGYNGGQWNGTNANGGAIITSATTGTTYGIGWADGAVGGISGITSGQLEIKYTLYGDTNLDGTVNSVDFGTLAANFGESGKVWDQGAFTYNGTVNSVDFGLLAANFGKSLGSNGDVATAADWAALDAFAEANGLMSEVPEPASVSIVLCTGLAMLARRRRRAD